jgi:hypothetical protein
MFVSQQQSFLICILAASLVSNKNALCAFTAIPPARVAFATTTTRSSLVPVLFLKTADDQDEQKVVEKEEWGEKQEHHLIHGAKQIHEETDEELLDSEEAAAFDAHDCDDSGMEAAMMERAVIIANEIAHVLKSKSQE